MSKYINQFLSLHCSTDVLAATGKLNREYKEITESMAIIKHLKPIVLAEKQKYTIYDLCAGNALTSILVAHMLPIKAAIAVDKIKRNGNYKVVEKFHYLEGDILDLVYKSEHPILISIHPCQTANLIVDIFNKNNQIKHLIMMPCCNDSYQDIVGHNWLRQKISAYDLWTLHLAQNIKNAKVKIVTDNNILSPKRNIIIANRQEDKNEIL